MKIAAKELQINYHGAALFAPLNFTVQSGEWWQIIGENGSGKSSLLKALARLLTPTCGKVQHDISASVAYLGHELGLKSDFTVVENIRLYWQTAAIDDLKLQILLLEFALYEHRHRLVSRLSRGQRQRLALVRTVLTSASLWLLDEPFTALDSEATTTCLTYFQRHLDDGGSIIMTGHTAIPYGACLLW